MKRKVDDLLLDENPEEIIQYLQKHPRNTVQNAIICYLNEHKQELFDRMMNPDVSSSIQLISAKRLSPSLLKLNCKVGNDLCSIRAFGNTILKIQVEGRSYNYTITDNLYLIKIREKMNQLTRSYTQHNLWAKQRNICYFLLSSRNYFPRDVRVMIGKMMWSMRYL